MYGNWLIWLFREEVLIVLKKKKREVVLLRKEEGQTLGGTRASDFRCNLINRLCFHLGGWLDKGIWVKVWKKLRYCDFHGKSSLEANRNRAWAL